MIQRLRNLWRLAGGGVAPGSLQRQLESLDAATARLIAQLESTRQQAAFTSELLTAARSELEAVRSRVAAAGGDLEALKARAGEAHLQFEQTRSLVTTLWGDMRRFEIQMDAARSKVDLDGTLFASLEEHRASEAYRRVYEQPAPLVSVCVTTYNRARLLVERCLPSILAQDHSNLEIIVVGDGCTDDTAEAVARLGDPRVRFENLQQREKYPEDAYARWMVAGTAAGNRSLELAKGDLITHLDDDDEFTPDRIRKLVAFLRETRAELIWHPFWHEREPNAWVECSASEFRFTQVTTGSVLYLAWFKRVPWDPAAYRYMEPGDWNRFRKLQYLGAKMKRFPELLLRHYAERRQDS